MLGGGAYWERARPKSWLNVKGKKAIRRNPISASSERGALGQPHGKGGGVIIIHPHFWSGKERNI